MSRTASAPEVFARGLRGARPRWRSAPTGGSTSTQEVGRIVSVGAPGHATRQDARGRVCRCRSASSGSAGRSSCPRRAASCASGSGTAASARPHAIVSGLPVGQHQQNNIVVGPDGRLYLGSGVDVRRLRRRRIRAAPTILSLPPGRKRPPHRRARPPQRVRPRVPTGDQRDLYATVNASTASRASPARQPAETAREGRCRTRTTAGRTAGRAGPTRRLVGRLRRRRRRRSPTSSSTRPRTASRSTADRASRPATATGCSWRSGASTAGFEHGRRVEFVALPSGAPTAVRHRVRPSARARRRREGGAARRRLGAGRSSASSGSG